jgi:hypothetical protein
MVQVNRGVFLEAVRVDAGEGGGTAAGVAHGAGDKGGFDAEGVGQLFDGQRQAAELAQIDSGHGDKIIGLYGRIKVEEFVDHAAGQGTAVYGGIGVEGAQQRFVIPALAGGELF